MMDFFFFLYSMQLRGGRRAGGSWGDLGVSKSLVGDGFGLGLGFGLGCDGFLFSRQPIFSLLPVFQFLFSLV